MKATKVKCPRCGAEFLLPQKSTTATVNVIGKDSNLGTIYLTLDNSSGKKSKAQERIEKMREAGIDVSKFFAMNDANGNETQVGAIVNGGIRILPEDDVVVRSILGGGTLLSSHLFKQHVLARMLKMLTPYDYHGYRMNGDYYDLSAYTKNLHQMGYDYQWKMLCDEFYRQAKMIEHGDMKSLAEDAQWYNKELVLTMMKDYIDQLQKLISTLRVKRHKGRPYVQLKQGKKVPFEGKESRYGYIYVDELEKLYNTFGNFIWRIEFADSIRIISVIIREFYETMIPLHFAPSHHKPNTPYFEAKQCAAWVDAYKGYGAYFSMQNLILFHGCTFEGKTKDESIQYLNDSVGNGAAGYWMLGALRYMLKTNNFDIAGKREEWRRKRIARLQHYNF
jgi:hypothetical protein